MRSPLLKKAAEAGKSSSCKYYDRRRNKSIYQSKQETEALNARTGNPVVKKDMTVAKAPVKKIVNLDQELAVANGS
jgi:hypothetical protein